MIAGDVSVGRAGRLALLAAGLVLGLLSLAVARGEPAYSLAGDATAAGAVELLAGWGLVAAGVAARARRPGSGFGPLAWPGSWPSGTTLALQWRWRSPPAWCSMPPAHPWSVMRGWCTRMGGCSPTWSEW